MQTHRGHAAASQVLILDSELQRVRIGGAQEPEALGYILTCAWKTRCWALQEGALAQARRYQMLDGVIDLETARPSRRDLFFGRMTGRIVLLHLFPDSQASCVPLDGVRCKFGDFSAWMSMNFGS